MMCQLEGYSAYTYHVSYTVENEPRHMMCQLKGYSAYISCFLYCRKCAKTHDVSVGRIFSIHIMFPIL